MDRKQDSKMTLLKHIVYFMLSHAPFVWKFAHCGTLLPSEFYQPGPGVYFEAWLTSSNNFPDFSQIPNYPDCPTFVSNGEMFRYSTFYSSQNQHGRFRALFVPKMDGSHRFFTIANNKVQLYIELNPEGPKKILMMNHKTGENWDHRQWSEEVNLMNGFRYELTVYYYGNGNQPEFFQLGVEFPDKTEEKPISKNYLWRSMEFYNWKGLIAHKYDDFNYPDSPSQYSLAKAYSMNPNYPNVTSSYQCKSTLYDQVGNQFNYYALRYIGYMNVSANGSYKFQMNCNEICQFFLTKNGVESSLGDYSDEWTYMRGQDWTDMDGGALSSHTLYPIKAFFTESWGLDYLQIKYQYNSDAMSTSWNGMLRNLLPEETRKMVPVPVPTVINSTAISASIPSTVFLPPRDSWNYIGRYEVLFHREGSTDPVKKVTGSGPLPSAVIGAGLKKYTEYLLYAHYYGEINGQEFNMITRYSMLIRTDQDVPESAPPVVTPKKQSSTAIRVTWNTLSVFSHWNGIGTGYEVQYRLSNTGASNWTSHIVNGISTRQYHANSLLKYRVYEFRVAARTIKGSGPFSSVVDERTKEDIPSAGPMNLSAHNTSSTSVFVAWDDIPAEHQNGVILGYKLYLRKAGTSEEWLIHDIDSKSFSKTGLWFWTIYDIKVSGRTSVGEGNSSEVIKVRTDEDVPSAAPIIITATGISATWLNLTWPLIQEDKRNGIILSYFVKYRRTDGKEAQNDVIVYKESASLQGLAAYEEYDVFVSGITSKGHGVFSSKFIFKTLESAPDAAPLNLNGSYINSTAIEIEWDLVPEEDRNGVIRRYIISYRARGDSSEWQEITVDHPVLTLQIGKLQYYTVYEFTVAAETSVGRGPLSNVTNIRTDAHAPSQPPLNLTGHFVNHTSIEMNWLRVPEESRHGIIIGYILHFRDETILNATWQNATVSTGHNGSDSCRCIVNGLKIYTPYSFKVQAFTYKGIGVLSAAVTVWTDEHEPEGIPRNISAQNASSTEIIFQWEDMKEAHGDANGKVLGYIIKYRVIDCHEDRPAGCDENHEFNITSYGSRSEIKIQNLRKYTAYSLSVQVFNSKGKSNFSMTINTTTDEDKPDMPPLYVEPWPLQSNSMKIYWSPIPESHRNGIILGYRIFFKAINEPLRRYERAPRSVNQYAIYGALPGEKMVEVNSSANSVEIKELRDYSWYQVRVGAFTSKGLGVMYATNGTTKQESPITAPKLQVIDMYGFTEMLLTWEPISKADARGEVLGYRIQYWLTELQETPVIQVNVHAVSIFAPNRTTVLKGLQPFARYRIRIQAFTEGGLGVWSQWLIGETCRCSKTLSSAKMILPPLVMATNLETVPLMLEKAITDCCGNCSRKHGISHVDWYSDSLNKSSVKYNKEELLEAIAAGTNLAVPMFMKSFEMEGDIENSLYVLVPLVQSRFLGIFMKTPADKDLANAASSIMTVSIWEQYPLLLISTILTFLSGILFWIFERGKNVDEFADKYCRGSGSGIWLAYITMTTVGYGDLTPKTVFGKLHAMIWMLIGLALTSMVTGNLTSIFSVEFVFEPSSYMASKDRVLTSADNFIFAVPLYGSRVHIGNTSDGRYVQESLLSGNASKVIMDLYTAASLKDYLIHPSIMLEKIERVDVSFGVALAGETKRIKNCVNRFAKENSELLHDKISRGTYIFQIGDQKSTDLLNHLISPSSDIMKSLTYYGVVILVVLATLGIIFEIKRCIRDRAKVKTDKEVREELVDDTLEDIADLESRIISLFDDAEPKYAKERVALTKMQYGRYTALVSMYPDLHTFDSEMPKSSKSEEARKENRVEKIDDDNDSSDQDMPIYYKRDTFLQ